MTSVPHSPAYSAPAWLRSGRDAIDPHVEQVRDTVTRLFVDHRAEIQRYLVNRGCPSTEAEEMAQEVFLRFYRVRLAGTRVATPRRWLFTVARNMAIDRLRHHRSARTLLGSALVDDAAERVVDSRPSGEDLLLSAGRRAALARALGELTDLQRECLHLRADGLSLLEIGAIVNVSVAGVSDAIRRAIRRLQKELDGHA